MLVREWDDLSFPSRPAVYIDCLLPRWHHQPTICLHTHLIIMIMTQANFLPSSPSLYHLYCTLYHFLFRTTQLHIGDTLHMVKGKMGKILEQLEKLEWKSSGFWAPVTGRRTRSEKPPRCQHERDSPETVKAEFSSTFESFTMRVYRETFLLLLIRHFWWKGTF